MSLNKITEYFLLSFLFLLPFQTAYLWREPFINGEKWQYGTIGVYGTDILFLCLVIFSGIAYWRKNPDLRLLIDEGRLFRWLMALIVWSGLSVFWAGDQVLAGYFFVKLLLGAGLFFAVRSFDATLLKKILFVLLLAGIIQSGIGIGQFLYQYSPASTWLGMSVHEASQAGSSVLKIEAGRFLRAYGTFPHPNLLGGFLGVVLVMGALYYVSGFRYKRSWKCLGEIVFTLSGLLVVFLGLLLTFSRTAWLGALLGVGAIGMYAFRQNESWIRRRFLKVFLAFGVAAVVFGVALQEQIFPRFDTTIIEREGSVSERILSLEDAEKLIGTHPIIGVGAGNFTQAVIGREPGRPVWSVQPAHNVFMLVWAELGEIGFVFFGAFLFQTLQQSNKNAKFGIALLVLIPSLLLDHWLWSSHFGLLFFFLILGLVSRSGKWEDLKIN